MKLSQLKICSIFVDCFLTCLYPARQSASFSALGRSVLICFCHDLSRSVPRSLTPPKRGSCSQSATTQEQEGGIQTTLILCDALIGYGSISVIIVFEPRCVGYGIL